MEKHRILVVDDCEFNFEVLDLVLSEAYALTWAKNGSEALELVLKAEKPDLILLDVMMPVMDGFETCSLLKADYRSRDIPIIFLTALGEVKNEARGFQLGAVDYITRPFNPCIVRARVATHLALYDQNKELQRLVDERTREIKETQIAVIECLGRAAEYKDNETGKHVIRMSWYAYLLAKAAGMNEADAETLRYAAPMHDVGKIKIPDEVLKCSGKLTEKQMALMKEHAQFGAKLIGDHDSDLLKMAKTVALSHHERWDGTGYPYGLKGEEIPLISRIVTIADVFDALTSRRPYKQAWSIDDALDYIDSQSGEHFDPALVPLLRKCLPQVMEIYNRYSDLVDTEVNDDRAVLSKELEYEFFLRR